MKYCDCIVLKKLLAGILQEKRDELLRFVQSRGVSESDGEDVLQEAYSYLLGYEVQEKMASLLESLETTSSEEVASPQTLTSLQQALTALLVHTLKLKCYEYHRKRIRDKQPESFGLLAQALVTEEMRMFIIELCSLSAELVTAVCDWLEGEGQEPANQAVLEFIECLAKNAGCTEQEKKYLRERVTHPWLPDRDLFPEMGRTSIWRLKKAVFLKVCKLLGLQTTRKRATSRPRLRVVK